MRYILSSLVMSLLAVSLAMGQVVKLSDNPEQFTADVQKLMATGGPVAVKAANDLTAVLAESRLEARQRERLMVLCRKMNQKRYQPVAHFAPLFESLYHAIYTAKPAVTAPDIDNLLLIAEKQFETNDAKAFARTMDAARAFLEQRELYGAKFNKTYLLGGTFAFRYVENGQTTTATESTSATSATAVAAPSKSNFDGWDAPVGIDTTQPREIGVANRPIIRRPIPTVSGPVITITNAILAIVANGDSVMVDNTAGDFLLRDGIWVGKGGTFSWALQGLADRYVTLTDYSMAVMNPRLLADDVTLTMQKGAKPIRGIFEYQSKKRFSNVPDQYPRFASYQNAESIPGLGSGLTYRGGLALAGKQLIGASASGQPALLTVADREGKTVFRVKSRKFEFRDSLITAPVAQFTGYIDVADSITHPAVQFKFDKETRVAWFNKVDRLEYGRVPFSDTYHKFYIQPEVARWDVPRKKIDFYQIGAKREVPVRMESFDYFQPQRYSDIATDYGFHPLQIIGNYITKTKQQSFLDDDITRFAPNINPQVLRGALSRMVLEGYIDRDDRTQQMRLSRKGILYVLAYNEKKDFDNFQINSYFGSNDSTKNATIDLNNKGKVLIVRGVDRFVISDSLKIFGLPTNKTIYIGKGRSLVFTGQMKSGNMRYNGADLAFDYDKFALNMNKIESITFTPEKLAAQGRTDEIGGDIKYEKPGSVLFATADNRSGKVKGKKTTQRLVMPEGMTVYFDQQERGSYRYNRKVYFKIPAIDNDSVGKGDISFIGTFHSDGIFPPFKAELKTMPDHTLGFTHTPPTSGTYPVYNSKSTVKTTSELVMDKTGLHTTGTLTHLAATLNAKQLTFMPDSVMASGETGQILESQATKVATTPTKKGQRAAATTATYYPNVALNNYTMKWWPQADSMVIATQKNSFNFFNGTTKLEGNLLVRASGLYGNGMLTRSDAEVESGSIKFNKDGFLADNAKLKVLSAGEVRGVANKPVLLGTDIDVDFDQAKGIVDLSINRDNRSVDDTLSSSMEFPYAAYKTNINRATWNMKGKTIAMKGDVKTSNFTATADEQEGLTFNAGAALYDIDKMTLNISGVPYVTAADARIYPNKGLVTVRRNGDMLPFTNARLELDTTSLHHRLRNGNIQVQSRTRFSGDATYLFTTAKGDTSAIKMGSFELKEAEKTAATPTRAVASRDRKKRGGASVTSQPLATYYTVARADIQEADRLMLAPKIQFKGDVLMKAPEKDLSLDGFIKPLLKKRPDLVSGWIPFKEKVLETIEVPVNDKLKNEGDQILVAGIHSRYGSPGIYPSFLSPKEDSRDDDIFRASGVMHYDEKEKTFVIGPKVGSEGLSDAFEGNFLFNDDKGIMTFRGAMNLLNARPNQYMLASGSARVNVDSAQYRINALLALTFALPEPINQAIATKLVEGNLEEKNDEPADDDLNRLSDKLLPLIGQKAVDDYRNKAQNQHVSLALASPKLNTTLVLANTNLRWSEKFSAFYTVGKLGVSNIQATDINAQMTGLLEIRKSGNGDELSVYIESSPEVWAFYDYKPGGKGGGQLAIVTSEQDINDRITALLSNNKGKSPLEVVPGTEDEKSLFVERYEAQYRVRVRPTKTAPKAKPAPKAEPTIAKEAEPAAADSGFGAEEAAPVKPTKGKGKSAKTKPERLTSAAETTPEETESVSAETTPVAKETTKAKAAKGKPAKGEPAKVAKKEPVKKEEKKDKEDEKEGF
ncbi:hypothetical protein J2I47_23000 [Fibrella sp. HMF5335]|uniref:Uncharacterized protein n=1 Tax=Fibrella rubiginis TaxID=2817060 RepID=A0A939GJF8_9BACT|nr:hypothetical protein [Fibrella rubiginis]MBO0939436.1 hypothetical protein [Fibrella rubiginis]